MSLCLGLFLFLADFEEINCYIFCFAASGNLTFVACPLHTEEVTPKTRDYPLSSYPVMSHQYWIGLIEVHEKMCEQHQVFVNTSFITLTSGVLLVWTSDHALHLWNCKCFRVIFSKLILSFSPLCFLISSISTCRITIIKERGLVMECKFLI